MIKIEAESPGNFEVNVFKEEIPNDQVILIVKAIGVHRYGSQGSPEANYLKNRAGQGAMLIDPDAVIFDYSELEYEWGNGLDYPIQVIRRIIQDDDRSLPIVLVAGDKSKEGIISYYKNRYTICSSMEEALEIAKQMAKEWLDELLRT